MGRNFYSAKHYTWKRNKDGGLVHCEENGKPLFCVYDDGQDDMLINAYMQGRRHGEQIGRAELQSEIRRVLGLQPPTIANAEQEADMCNACGFQCCGSDMFGGCGCDGCDCEECWSDDEEEGDESAFYVVVGEADDFGDDAEPEHDCGEDTCCCAGQFR